MNFLLVSGCCLAVLVAAQALTFAIGRRIGRYNVVDVTWGAGFVAVAAVSAALGGGDPTRRLVMLVLTAAWGLRLTWHMVGKSRGKGEDPRYEELLGGDFSARNVLLRIFATQALAGWFISLPLQLSATLGPTRGPLLVVGAVGLACWLTGVAFESIGDRQLKAFKADGANKGKIMDRGLWAWTRHPNYFGDSAVWWGLWLVSLAAPVSLATVLSPVVMTYFLVYATGARPTERIMADRKGFREYSERTSFFLPWPPKRGAT